MGSNGCDQVMLSGSHEANCPKATVEIKIKTLDSQTYTLRVDKCVPVPALKEKIASVTGVVSEQQRLICRGSVLKDDQLLSAYHVEDGHTLHLVVRQPIPPSSSLPDHPATDPASSAGQVGRSVVVETFDISEQGDGVFPDFSHFVSAVLRSFGITNIGSSSERIDLREPTLERLSRNSGLSGLSNSSRRQPDQATARNQSSPPIVNPSWLHTPTALEPQQPPVIHDSLTTVSQYLSHLRHDFGANGGNGNSLEAAVAHESIVQESDSASRVAAGQSGLPGPASLAEVMLSMRQLLIEQAADCLSHLARQLEDQANVTEPSTRLGFQTNALRSGALLQNLGASLLELGRTTMTLQLGQTPTDAAVSAGPAVFISTSGPNPLMVQALPFQMGTSFGAIPIGTSEPASGLFGGTLGSGFLPRNIDLRTRTGIVNQREQNAAQPSLGQVNSAVSGGESSIYQAAAGTSGVPSSIRASEVRVVPVRTVVAAVPAARRTPSDTSHSSAGLFHPVLARVRHVTSGNVNSARGSQSSSEHDPSGLDTIQQPLPESAGQQQTIRIPGRDDNNHSGHGNQNGQGFSTELRSRLHQLFRTIFSVEEIHDGGDANFQSTATNSGTVHSETTEVVAEVAADMQEGGPRVGDEAADTQEAGPRVVDEGAFLSNVLCQIMPFISQNRAMDSNSASSEENNNNRQTSSQAPNSNVRTSSRQADPPSPPSAKRQKRE